MTSLIEAVHSATNKVSVTKNALRVHIKRAQCVDKAFLGEFMSIMTPKRGQGQSGPYELTFFENDLYSVDTPHNDALFLMVNINMFDVKRFLINLGSSS